MKPQKINLAEKFALFSEYWRPKIVGDLNENYLKLVKLKNDFVWHRHENEDELFIVIKGELVIKFRDGDIIANPGEMILIPKNVEHCPSAKEEVWVMLVEPKSVINTGDVYDEKTVKNLERI